MNRASFFGLRRARPAIMKLSHIDLARGPLEEYLEALIVAINMVATKALGEYPLSPNTEPDSEEALLQQSLQRIQSLTSEELRQSGIYCGHDSTLSAVWCEATCMLEVQPDLFVYEGDRRVISLGELYGPFPCEHEGDGGRCGTRAFSIYVSRGEMKGIPYDSGPGLIHAVTGQNSKGTALCERHSPPLKKDAVIPIPA